MQWLRDQLGIIDTAEEIEALAASVPDSGGVVFVPALAGLGAPHWRPDARGTFTGITGYTTKAHIARAVLEGIALQIADILGAMEADAGLRLSGLRVDGGAARNNLLMQFQADILRTPAIRPTVLETTALGSAFLAGLAVGFWVTTDSVREAWTEDATFFPDMRDDEVEGHLAAWAAAVAKALRVRVFPGGRGHDQGGGHGRMMSVVSGATFPPGYCLHSAHHASAACL